MPHPPRPPARLVALVSGSGTTLGALLEACADPAYGASVVAAIADRDGTGGLERAAARGVPTAVVRPGDHPDRAAWDVALAEAIAAHAPDLVVSLGFMRLLGPAVLDRFPGRVANTHPALLPAFPGTHAVRDALAYGVKLTGATLHLVDAGVDTGPVVAQCVVAVRPDDDESGLHERVKEHERAMVVEHVGRMVREGWTVEGRKVTIP